MLHTQTTSQAQQHLPAGDHDPQATRACRRPRFRVRKALAPLLAGMVSASGLALAPAHANDLGTFTALEIFEADHAPDTAARCGRRVRVPGMERGSALPRGTTASVVLEGPFGGTRGTGACRIWKIGHVWVVVKGGTRLPETTPPRGRLLRAVTDARVGAWTKLVASKVVDRKRSAIGGADMEVAYVNTFVVVSGDDANEVPFVGCVRAPQRDQWTVHASDGHPHVLDVAEARAGGEIEGCLGQGDTVMAEFVPQE